jgi:hypothetical protein
LDPPLAEVVDELTPATPNVPEKPDFLIKQSGKSTHAIFLLGKPWKRRARHTFRVAVFR